MTNHCSEGDNSSRSQCQDESNVPVDFESESLAFLPSLDQSLLESSASIKLIPRSTDLQYDNSSCASNLAIDEFSDSHVTAEPRQAQEKPMVDRLIQTIRVLTVGAVEKAQSGHPGMPLGMAPTVTVFWMSIFE